MTENFLAEDSSLLHGLPLRSLGKQAPETAATKKNQLRRDKILLSH